MTFKRETARAGQAMHEAGHTFEPRYPDGTGIGATITVRGPDSEVVRALVRRQLQAAQDRDAQARKSRRDPEPPTIEQIEAEAIDLAAAYTITWADFEDDGKPMQCTDVTVRQLYREAPWIRRQVIAEAQDLGNFVRPPLPSSSSTREQSLPST